MRQQRSAGREGGQKGHRQKDGAALSTASRPAGFKPDEHDFCLLRESGRRPHPGWQPWSPPRGSVTFHDQTRNGDVTTQQSFGIEKKGGHADPTFVDFRS